MLPTGDGRGRQTPTSYAKGLSIVFPPCGGFPIAQGQVLVMARKSGRGMRNEANEGCRGGERERQGLGGRETGDWAGWRGVAWTRVEGRQRDGKREGVTAGMSALGMRHTLTVLGARQLLTH